MVQHRTWILFEIAEGYVPKDNGSFLNDPVLFPGVFIGKIRPGLQDLADPAVGGRRSRACQKDVCQKLERGQDLGQIGNKGRQSPGRHGSRHDLAPGGPDRRQGGHGDGQGDGRLQKEHHAQGGKALCDQVSVDPGKAFLFIVLPDKGFDDIFVGDSLGNVIIERVQTLLHGRIPGRGGLYEQIDGQSQKGYHHKEDHGQMGIHDHGHDKSSHQHDGAAEGAPQELLGKVLDLGDIVGDPGDQSPGGEIINLGKRKGLDLRVGPGAQIGRKGGGGLNGEPGPCNAEDQHKEGHDGHQGSLAQYKGSVAAGRPDVDDVRHHIGQDKFAGGFQHHKEGPQDKGVGDPPDSFHVFLHRKPPGTDYTIPDPLTAQAVLGGSV